MIIKIALLLLYLVVGLWLFVITLTDMGGKKAVFNNNFVFVMSMLTVIIFWPVLVMQGIIKGLNKRRK